MVLKHQEQLGEVQEKQHELEEVHEQLAGESSLLGRDLESAKARIDELLQEENRM